MAQEKKRGNNESAVLEFIDFIEKTSLKIYGLRDDISIFNTVTAAFKQSKRYTASIIVATDEPDKLRVVSTVLPTHGIRDVEKIAGTKVKGFRIDLAKSKYYRQVINEGKTIYVKAPDILADILPRPIAMVVTRILRMTNKVSVLTPLMCQGKVIGVLGISSSPIHTNTLIISIKNLGSHVSRALDLAAESRGREKAQAAFREATQTLHEITQSSMDGIFSLDKEGSILTYASPATLQLVGYHPDEVEGKSFPEFISPQSLPHALKAFKKVLHGESVEKISMEVKQRDGQFSPIEINAFPIIKKGKVVGIRGIIRDVSERAQILEHLGEVEQRHRAVLENIGVGVAMISPRMEILALNRQMVEWFPTIDVAKRPLCYRSFNNPPTKDVCSYCPTVQTLQDGCLHEAVTDTPKGDKIIHYRVVSSPIKNQKGKVVAAVEMVEDITERQHMEEKIVEQEKMAALGRIASVVSHELNTPLANISLTTDYLAKKLGRIHRAELSVIKTEVGHASHIIRRILSFSRMENLELNPLSLSGILSKAVSNVQNLEISRGVSIDNRVQSSIRIQGHTAYLQEAFTNILTNAVEAADPVKKRHRVTIEAQQSKKSVTITVTDTGVGIPDGTLEHIFKPFFTTKTAEDGTGLGLYITQWIIQQHKGSISVSSAAEVGTTVSVTFPSLPHP